MFFFFLTEGRIIIMFISISIYVKNNIKTRTILRAVSKINENRRDLKCSKKKKPE